MKSKVAVVALLGFAGFMNTASANPDELQKMHDFSRNASGLLSYCVDKGYLKSDSLEVASKFKAFVANVPGMKATGGDDIEANGRQGKIHLGDGQYDSLEKAPQGPAAWCQEADAGLRKGLAEAGQ